MGPSSPQEPGANETPGSPVAPTRRKYDASRRRAAAEERRTRVVEVAGRLFPQQGWTATTISQVAAEAGVSPELIGTTYGTKAALFMAAFRHATTGAQRDLPAAVRDLDLENLPDIEARLDAVVAFALSIYAPMAPYVPLLLQAADQDPAAAAELQGATARHRVAAAFIARSLLGHDPGPDVVEEIFVLTLAHNYLAFVRDSGWSTEQYAAWLRRSLRHAVTVER